MSQEFEMIKWWRMSVNEAISDPLHQHLFRIFSFFADPNPQGTLHSSQSEFIIDELLREAGRPTTSKRVELPDDVTFRELLNLLQLVFPDRRELEPTTDRVFERFINHVISHVFVLFRRTPQPGGCFGKKKKPTGWMPGWCVLMPGQLRICDLQGDDSNAHVELDENSVVEVPVLDVDRYVWTVSSSTTDCLYLAHFDQLAARSLLRDIRLACDQPTRERLSQFDLRRSIRSRPSGDKEDIIRKKFEKEKFDLEQELEEERQNRKDEEIVRGLATRMLEEERQKSEQMQRVLAELQTKINKDNYEEESQGDFAEKEPSVLVEEKGSAEITLPSREEQLQHYAYHVHHGEFVGDLVDDEVNVNLNAFACETGV